MTENLITKGGAVAGKLTAVTDVQATDDLIAGDDLTVGDDASVAGDLSVTGQFQQIRSLANIADGGSMAATAAQVVTSRIITATPTTARNIQLPAAADIIALTGSTVGTTVEFLVVNLAATTHALTLTVNTGTTIQGSATIAANTNNAFLVRVASSTTVVVYKQ
ncbi:MAG: hypothetical protein EBT75_00115 [Proteobacteria bacterium]|nr:hypothetical protein [Pseudomonadota bacterium]NBS49070.1 hypothetical protein [Verrucomicrobiota bacterium]